MVKKLAVFDFDHTIIDDNTDTAVRDLIPRDAIPASVRQLHKSDGWTAYMQAIFDLLHKNHIDEATIRRTVECISPTRGMRELITELSGNLNYDVVIISDSNSYFINAWLAKCGLDASVTRVFTNPAFFAHGSLKIRMYHLQTGCKLSTKNLCKGRILDEFVDGQGKKNVFYESVLYVGDGLNDFCPILRLKEGDLACVRDKYKCHELVKLAANKKPIDDSGIVYEIKSNVLVWTDGLDILNRIRVTGIMDLLDDVLVTPCQQGRGRKKSRQHESWTTVRKQTLRHKAKDLPTYPKCSQFKKAVYSCKEKK